MNYELKVMTIEYTKTFGRPFLSLPRINVEITKTIYDALSDDYGITISDLQVGGGSSFSDIFVRVFVRKLRGFVELRVDRFQCSFRELADREQIADAKILIQRLEKILISNLPDITLNSTSISATSWISCEGGAVTVRQIFEKYHHAHLESRLFGATSLVLFLRGRLQNEKEGWSTFFALEPSVPKDFDLYFVCVIDYANDGRYGSFEERADHFERLHTAILEHGLGVDQNEKSEQ